MKRISIIFASLLSVFVTSNAFGDNKEVPHQQALAQTSVQHNCSGDVSEEEEKQVKESRVTDKTSENKSINLRDVKSKN